VRERRVFGALALGACAALAASGCGAARQDVHEPRRAYTIRVLASRFPPLQAISRPTSLLLLVQNTSALTAPNVAVTLDSFYYTEHFPELAANKRPVWIVDQGPGRTAQPPVESAAISPPGGGQTAYVNTWALGPLAPGATRAFRWLVVPVKAGVHTVHYSVASGLAGKATARLSSGGLVHGQFTAYIAPTPPSRHVDPRTGQVVPGPFPVLP
jgi:hypothetical protein